MKLQGILIGNKFLISQRYFRGFVFIELLVVIAIMIIAVAAVIPMYGELQGSSQLNENSSQIIQNSRIAKERSVSRLNNSSHGIYFGINPLASDQYILYQGDSYATRDTNYDRVFVLGDALSFSSSGFTLIGDDIDINFSKGKGFPNNTGVLTLTHEVKGSQDINVNSFGLIEAE